MRWRPRFPAQVLLQVELCSVQVRTHAGLGKEAMSEAWGKSTPLAAQMDPHSYGNTGDTSSLKEHAFVLDTTSAGQTPGPLRDGIGRWPCVVWPDLQPPQECPPHLDPLSAPCCAAHAQHPWQVSHKSPGSQGRKGAGTPDSSCKGRHNPCLSEPERHPPSALPGLLANLVPSYQSRS